MLGPLERWLRSQVGRPWDVVYSDACAVIRADSVVRAHIKNHLLEFVERHTFMKGGEVWCFVEYGPAQEVPVNRALYRRSGFFVHPLTRLLQPIPEGPRMRRRDPQGERRRSTQRWLCDSMLLRRLNGCWFECRVLPFPRRTVKGDSPWRFDAAAKKAICRSDADDIYGRRVYCVAKRQLSRRELKREGLSNGMGGRAAVSQSVRQGWLTAALPF
ncbi:MAG: hypothetical protein HYR88_18170 [Verrucomicrobia bacterium]|nr:hypothetical protein [Verrucomicrobiota bacterium]MBI3869238.1 hypothetical protein [Verrucomicrobiota bacterium]